MKTEPKRFHSKSKRNLSTKILKNIITRITQDYGWQNPSQCSISWHTQDASFESASLLIDAPRFLVQKLIRQLWKYVKHLTKRRFIDERQLDEELSFPHFLSSDIFRVPSINISDSPTPKESIFYEAACIKHEYAISTLTKHTPFDQLHLTNSLYSFASLP